MLRIAIIAVLFYVSYAQLTDVPCTNKGGVCQNWKHYKCTAGYETGLCSGDSDNRCCHNCDYTCAITEQNYVDTACESSGGTCQHNTNYCARSYESGLCGGPNERQCCTSSTGGGGGGDCDLVLYSSLYVKGYNGLDVDVHSDFVPSMNSINTFARQCGVTVWVTHAFREEGQSLGGTVVPPATYSNHLVGHAIDFNVDTPNGWCNGDCLYAGYNSYAECFIQKVMNSGLRWGGVWSPSDPVHIDDGLNGNDFNTWNDLYYQLQGACY